MCAAKIMQYFHWQTHAWIRGWLWEKITVWTGLMTFAPSSSSLSTSYNSIFHMSELLQPWACYILLQLKWLIFQNLVLLSVCHTCPSGTKFSVKLWAKVCSVIPLLIELCGLCAQVSGSRSGVSREGSGIQVQRTMSSLYPGRELRAAGKELPALPSGVDGRWVGEWRRAHKTPCGPKCYISRSYSCFSGASPVIVNLWVTPQSVGFLFVLHLSPVLTFMKRDGHLFFLI